MVYFVGGPLDGACLDTPLKEIVVCVRCHYESLYHLYQHDGLFFVHRQAAQTPNAFDGCVVVEAEEVKDSLVGAVLEFFPV